MLILFLVITIVSTVIVCKFDFEVSTLLLVFLDCVSIIILAFAVIGIIEYQGIEEKLQIYNTQNQQLERKIDTVVKSYIGHEKDAYKEFKPGDGVTLIATYPELKSNELIKEQINTYQSNNRKILKLKEKQVDYNVLKWWIYFGGK